MQGKKLIVNSCFLLPLYLLKALSTTHFLPVHFPPFRAGNELFFRLFCHYFGKPCSVIP